MRNRYIFLIIVLIVLALVGVFLPDKDNSNREIQAVQLLNELNQNTRYFTTDEVADLLINNDPSIQLIDVRTQAEFSKFSLPEAVNIPLDDILNEEWKDALDQSTKKNIFYSNGTVASTEAWMICRRLGYSNNFIMEGGLNAWIETIINPVLPATDEIDKAVMDQYMFRKAASQYFGQGKAVESKAEPVKKVKSATEVVKEEKAKIEKVKVPVREVEGGC